MSPNIHELDPDYDTVIVLEQPCKNFMPWGPSEENLDLEALGPDPEAWPTPVDCCDNPNSTSITDGSVSAGNVEVSAGASLSSNHGDIETAKDIAGDEEGIIYYHVSSRHLTLASSWFKRTLTSPGSKEAVANPADGRFYIRASDWDEEAFLILLATFHLRKRRIPKATSLEMLAKIAMLVDYYDLEEAEAIEDYVDTWVAHARRSYPVPTTYSRDLVLWIFVSATFNLSNEFEKATYVAIQQSTRSIETLGLPIPFRATREIENKRNEAIERIISELHCLLEKYRSADYSCPDDSVNESPFDESYSFQCGAFLFGALYKELKGWGFLSPRPETPFRGLSLEGICSKISTVRSPIWYHESLVSKKRCTHPSHQCSLKDEIDKIVQHSMKNDNGLKLSELKAGR